MCPHFRPGFARLARTAETTMAATRLGAVKKEGGGADMGMPGLPTDAGPGELACVVAVHRRRRFELPWREGGICMSDVDLALSIVLGVGLAAATGFRVFLPMLIVSAAANTGHLALDGGFAWLGTPAALTMFCAAALAEVVAYYIPGVDNLLDALATPSAFVAMHKVAALQPAARGASR